MDIITTSVTIRGTTDAAAAIIAALCAEDASEAEQWRAIRTVRNELLAQTDYTMLPDAPPDTQAEVDAMAAYRQALRDIPQTYETPADVEFPVMP